MTADLELALRPTAFRRDLPPTRLAADKALIDHYGGGAVFFGRFVAVLRETIAWVASLARGGKALDDAISRYVPMRRISAKNGRLRRRVGPEGSITGSIPTARSTKSKSP